MPFTVPAPFRSRRRATRGLVGPAAAGESRVRVGGGGRPRPAIRRSYQGRGGGREAGVHSTRGSEAMSSTSTVPAPGGIVLFDGTCAFCEGAVRFIARRDPAGYFRFGASQTPDAARLLAPFGLSRDTARSLILIEGGRCYLRSTASLRIAARLTRPWRWLAVCLLVPAPSATPSTGSWPRCGTAWQAGRTPARSRRSRSGTGSSRGSRRRASARVAQVFDLASRHRSETCATRAGFGLRAWVLRPGQP